MTRRATKATWSLLFPMLALGACGASEPDARSRFAATVDPTTTLWYTHPAEEWDNALPVGNGRLGAMVFGRTDEERIHFNEETYWSGGPYSTTVKGGFEALPRIQAHVFAGEYLKAHNLFGRHLMGYPVEQMKYQSMGDLILKLPAGGDVDDYVHALDLDRAIATVQYRQDGVRFTREVFSSAVDQVIVVRVSADRRARCRSWPISGGIGTRPTPTTPPTTSGWTDAGPDGLVLAGKSADYLGVEGRLRYEARVKAVPEGGSVEVEDVDLTVTKADAVTLYIAAATSFVDYRDVSGDPEQRIADVLGALEGRSYEEVRDDHVADHQRYFRRVSIDLGPGPNSFLPTDERLEEYRVGRDPDLAALSLQFGRYLLIASSRPGTQPANLQGIWNEDMNPSWDSKYTTNINTQMNYWPAEVGNLSELTEPLTRLVRELTDQGSDVAREHYGARGWVHHQNTDLWRVAAPMDGPTWGTFTTGGAWLATHLWEHYLYTGDEEYLEEVYPILRGSVEFFLDFLVEHPRHGWLVTNPSTSPENFPDRPGNEPYFDEVDRELSPRDQHLRGLDHRHADPPRPVRRLRRGVRGAGCGRGAARRGPGGPRPAGPDADRGEGRPAGVARGLGPEGEEPPAHLPPLRAVPRATRSRRRGRPSWPRPAGWCWSRGGSRATGGPRPGRWAPGPGSGRPGRPWRTSSTTSGTTRSTTSSPSAPGRSRSTAAWGWRRRWRRCCCSPTRTGSTSCRLSPPPGGRGASAGSGPGVASRST